MALTVASRGDHVESIHKGTFVVADPESNVVVAAGDPHQRTYMRSSAKPFQSMALILTGTADALGLSDRELAIASSSHSGEPEHVEAVLSLLSKGGVPVSALLCGIHPPLDATAARELLVSGESPTPLHNNCSGKHAAMVVVCRFMGWSLDTYRDPDHPLQQLNLETLAAFTGEQAGEIGMAVDGCGVPVFYVRIQGVATAFARLATGREVSDEHAAAARRIRNAMMAHPFLVGGTRRFDTQLMTATGGAAVCKGGAQGGEGVGMLRQQLGMGLKISDGSSGSIGPVTIAVLDAFEAIDRASADQLSEYRDQPIRNHAGKVVGETRVTFAIQVDAE